MKLFAGKRKWIIIGGAAAAAVIALVVILLLNHSTDIPTYGLKGYMGTDQIQEIMESKGFECRKADNVLWFSGEANLLDEQPSMIAYMPGLEFIFCGEEYPQSDFAYALYTRDEVRKIYDRVYKEAVRKLGEPDERLENEIRWIKDNRSYALFNSIDETGAFRFWVSLEWD